MFAQPTSRSALLAGLLTAALVVPAWSAEPETPASERPAVLAASPQTGPIIARESLATQTRAPSAVVVGEGQPTRGSGSLTVGKRYAGTRGSVAYARPVYRHSLMLGIGY